MNATATLQTPRPLTVVAHPAPADEYQAIYAIVAQLDDDLTAGRVHYRNRAGKLLKTLDEVVRAVLNDDLEVRSAD